MAIGRWFLPLFFLLARVALADSQLADADKIRQFFGMSPAYDRVAGLEAIKIAVLDTGFDGYAAHKEMLPTTAMLVEKYPEDFIQRYQLGDPKVQIGLAPGDHGRRMAQIAWGVTGGKPQGPRFFLLNANGITNFRRAVRFAIEQNADIILYSQNWECCGNFDGGGFINQVVNQATQAGALWINAAGNYGGMVYNGPVRIGADLKSVVFGAHGESSALRFQSHLDENPVQIILTWNAFTDDETAGTDKDLDLEVYDETGRLVGASRLNQVLKKDKLQQGETFLAREKVSLELAKSSPGRYYTIRVVSKHGTYGATDRLRVTLVAERPSFYDPQQKKMIAAIDFTDATAGREIMVPADNPSVLTVGDPSPASSMGPTLDDRVKPDVLLASSEAVFTDGLHTSGTSNSAAYFAGIAAVLKAQEHALNRERLMRYIAGLPIEQQPGGDDSTPVTPPLSPTESPVSLAFVSRYYDAILRTVEQLSGGESIEALRRQNGQLILEMSRFSADMAPLFPQFPWGRREGQYDAYEFYLVTRHFTPPPGGDPKAYVRVFGFARPKNGAFGQPAPYPWDIYHEDPRHFVELRLKHGDDPTPLPPPQPTPGPGPQPAGKVKVWRTPTPSELHDLVVH